MEGTLGSFDFSEFGGFENVGTWSNNPENEEDDGVIERDPLREDNEEEGALDPDKEDDGFEDYGDDLDEDESD